MAILILTYLCVGAVVGVLAGLLGVGGGLVIVPMLAFCFERQDMPQESLMHLAMGTSAASIVFTSVSSFWGHHQRGAVVWRVVLRIALGILAGAVLGTFLASRLSTYGLKGFFAVFLCCVALQMLLDRKPRPGRELPGGWGMSAVGTVIGAISSLAGIGGGIMSVPFLLWCNQPHAVGPSGPRRPSGFRSPCLPAWGMSSMACKPPHCRRTRSVTCICRPWPASSRPAC